MKAPTSKKFPSKDMCQERTHAHGKEIRPSVTVETRDSKTLLSSLQKIGRIRGAELKEPLLSALHADSQEVQRLALKHLAKLRDISLLPIFDTYADQSRPTTIRTAATAALGRLRRQETIPLLKKKLHDDHPNVILQAIRGLLVFKKEPSIQRCLEALIDHPNELVRSFLTKEFLGNSRKMTASQGKNSFPLKNTVVHADVIQALERVDADSIHLTFTSPPYYNARDYSTYKSYSEYLSFLEAVFKEVHRVTKEGRFFILNTSPVIVPRPSRAHSSKRYPIPYDVHPLLVKMGWEFIDDIVWTKPEASVKNRNAGFLQHRKPLAYKPNAKTEMIMVYRKQTDKLIDWNIKQYTKETVDKSKVMEPYETSNLWHIDPTFDKVHTAVFPAELCRRIIKLYSYLGDLVLDPFAGSGTLGKVALELDRNFLLVEKESKYFRRMQQTFLKKHAENSLLEATKTPVNFMTLKEFSDKMKGSLA